jgi:cysteine desulfurase
MPIYLDHNATTPVIPEVREAVLRHLDIEFGNAGSRTHEYGARAKKAVEEARAAVAEIALAEPSDVLFTSGATEANNLAILGLAAHGARAGRRHLVTTAIEHKAVLEPMQALEAQGFELTIVPVDSSGRVRAEDVLAATGPATLLVSVMQANNETGIQQPILEIAAGLAESEAFFHVDAVQGFGKALEAPRHKRIDLLSVSAHKLFGPKGVGALITRRRGYDRPPLTPLMYGGGQERGLRPGTLATPLIAGFGVAAKVALRDHAARAAACRAAKAGALADLARLDPTPIGDQAYALDHVLAVAFTGVDSEALMLALRDEIAISNGSACTSSSYEPSHVLKAMGLPNAVVEGAVRISWSHLSPPAPWQAIAARIEDLRAFA